MREKTLTLCEWMGAKEEAEGRMESVPPVPWFVQPAH